MSISDRIRKRGLAERDFCLWRRVVADGGNLQLAYLLRSHNQNCEPRRRWTRRVATGTFRAPQFFAAAFHFVLVTTVRNLWLRDGFVGQPRHSTVTNVLNLNMVPRTDFADSVGERHQEQSFSPSRERRYTLPDTGASLSTAISLPQVYGTFVRYVIKKCR